MTLPDSKLTFTADRELFASGSARVADRAAEFLQRIDQYSDLNAFISVSEHAFGSLASDSDERYTSGLQRPLEGLAIALKDNISFKGLRLTCASRILETFEPVFNATVVERLLNSGALIIGKTNMDEFAMGSSSEHSYFGPVKNPLDPQRVPGGSSGGSAVAVAARMCHVALGSDTGGSVRQPAAFCGVVGFKPSYGRISRYGLVAFASSLDQIGIFARSVDDAALVFDVIKGHDPMDSTSVATDTRQSTTQRKGYRVGFLSDEFIDGCDESVRSAYALFREHLISRGAEVSDVSLPNKQTWIPTYFILATAEASSNLARYDGVRYGVRADDTSSDMITATRTAGFGKEVQRRIMLGTYVLSSGYYDAYYKKAQQTRRLIAEAYAEVFNKVDFIAMPTAPTTAFQRGEITDPVQMWLSDLYTVSANIAGIPAISLPFGTDSSGLPIGMQLQGAMFSDEDLLQFSGKLISA
ncbi:MAG: Asp-tRNA(Asn)/Glu-tRNA(Gln) amidotransferase subunit GatA [Ignavibacteria bacterium]|nr:Asp-tRNA(Asn)/Glu-tRNA(Gln) amidotransferase subunit GatA [Ignavibacteria bacterium]